MFSYEICFVLRQHRTNELVRQWMNLVSDAIADFECYLEGNREICKQQMPQEAPLTLPVN